jgi:hypothetical protein
MVGKKNGEIINPISPIAENMRKTFSVKYRSEKCISKALIMRKIWVTSNMNRNASNMHNHFVIKYCPAKTFESFRCIE